MKYVSTVGWIKLLLKLIKVIFKFEILTNVQNSLSPAYNVLLFSTYLNSIISNNFRSILDILVFSIRNKAIPVMSIAMDLKCHLPPRQNSNQDRSLHKLAVRPYYQHYQDGHWIGVVPLPSQFPFIRDSLFSLLITKSEYFFLRSISLSTTLSRKFPNPSHKGPSFHKWCVKLKCVVTNGNFPLKRS